MAEECNPTTVDEVLDLLTKSKISTHPYGSRPESRTFEIFTNKEISQVIINHRISQAKKSLEDDGLVVRRSLDDDNTIAYGYQRMSLLSPIMQDLFDWSDNR